MCGAKLRTVIATRPISEGEILVAQSTPHDVDEPGTWITRFHGRCKGPTSTNPRARVGVVINKVDGKGRTQEVARYAWPLSCAGNAQMAEAFGSGLAIEMAIRHVWKEAATK